MGKPVDAQLSALGSATYVQPAGGSSHAYVHDWLTQLAALS
jgi:hypothetical protein